ncbi:MAG: apolipoprotein N-acyltransferase, partial [Candidatus Cloacimonetes bacterium]|nr:apolipoprotein N-acyltransferase [Candidatus Cloacimonadota bacterium]
MRISALLSKTWIWKPALAAMLAGLSRLPVSLGWLVFWSFLPLLSFWEEKPDKKQLILAGLVYSTIYSVVCLHWISLVTVPGFFGLLLLFGFYFALLFSFIGLLWQWQPRFKYLFLIFCWISFEFLQSLGEFRFPWFNIGYALTDYLVLLQAADLGGVYLLSLLILLINIFIFRIRKTPGSSLLLMIIVLICWIVYGIVQVNTFPLKKTNLNIAMIQASIPQNLKWEESFLDSTLHRYAKLTSKAAESAPDLIVWPESALPVYLLKHHRYRFFVEDLIRETGVDIFTGFPDYEPSLPPHPQRYKFYNSASLFRKNGTVDEPFRKNILVPVGERMPLLGIFPFLWNIQLGQANFEYGDKITSFNINNHTFSAIICFEIAFPEITSAIARKGADFIINITNDAWFHRSAGTYQHAAMTVLRAIETRKSIYRCANTGYSMIVSPLGEILEISDLFEQKII